MFQALRKKWRHGKVQTAYLVLLAVFFLGAFMILPALSADGSKVVPTSPASGARLWNTTSSGLPR